MLFRKLFILISSIIVLGGSFVFATKAIKCVPDISKSSTDIFGECNSIWYNAVSLGNEFNKILFKGKESKREMITNWLDTNAIKKSAADRYEYQIISEYLKFTNYTLNGVKDCQAFETYLFDAPLVGGKIVFAKNIKTNNCDITTISDFSGVYAETRCGFSMKEMSDWQISNKKRYAKYSGDSMFEVMSYIQDKYDNTRCSIQNQNDVSKKLTQERLKDNQLMRIIAINLNIQQLTTVVYKYQSEKSVFPVDIKSITVKDYISSIPKNFLSGSVCNKTKFEDLYFLNSSKDRFAFIVPTFKLSEVILNQDDMSKRGERIGDPTIFFDNCKTIKWNLFDKDNSGNYQYQKYSCAKNLKSCPKNAQIVIINHSIVY